MILKSRKKLLWKAFLFTCEIMQLSWEIFWLKKKNIVNIWMTPFSWNTLYTHLCDTTISSFCSLLDSLFTSIKNQSPLFVFYESKYTASMKAQLHMRELSRNIFENSISVWSDFTDNLTIDRESNNRQSNPSQCRKIILYIV